MPTKEIQYDVLVIGGGPAGMMAAGRAAQLGAKVLLLEKNATLGKKLLITGGGRCNVTNAEFDKQVLLAKFKDNKKFLFSPFSQFGVQETLEFFYLQHMPTKVEAEQRVFPVSNSAQSVWDVLVAYMQQGNVTVRPNAPVTGFEKKDSVITGVRLQNGNIVRAHSYILATGGKSRPETGSTGDGFIWLQQVGHTVIEPTSALVPVKIQEAWVGKLSGLSLQDVKLTVWQNDAKQAQGKGKMLFTHFGLSGPLVLNMSRSIGESLQYGPVIVSLDLLPGSDLQAVDLAVQQVLKDNQNKMIKNSLGHFVAPTLAPVLIRLANIDPEKYVNLVTREERLTLCRLLKHLPMTVEKLMGLEKAVVTSGGVDLKEVDFKTMCSRLFTNLYLVGDVLNIDRPSGGYSLQLCWTTGFVAGNSAATD